MSKLIDVIFTVTRKEYLLPADQCQTFHANEGGGKEWCVQNVFNRTKNPMNTREEKV